MYEAILRLLHPGEHIHGDLMTLIAAVGLVISVFSRVATVFFFLLIYLQTLLMPLFWASVAPATVTHTVAETTTVTLTAARTAYALPRLV